jgi:tRNA (adenine22-N1)-methyltransferase
VFLAKWQRLLRQKHKTLASFQQARQAVPQAKVQELVQQVQWITALLA